MIKLDTESAPFIIAGAVNHFKLSVSLSVIWVLHFHQNPCYNHWKCLLHNESTNLHHVCTVLWWECRNGVAMVRWLHLCSQKTWLWSAKIPSTVPSNAVGIDLNIMLYNQHFQD